jgi:hypothetical protein
VSVNVALAPLLRRSFVQVTVPPAPGAGVVHAKAGPSVCASDTNVVPAGNASVSTGPNDVPGPLLRTVTE